MSGDTYPDKALLGTGESGDDVEAVTEALVQKWHERARDHAVGTPEEHCRSLAQHLADSGFSLKRQE